MSDVFTRLDNIEEALEQHADAIKALGGHIGALLAKDERVPVTLTEATFDETGVQIRGVIPHDQAVQLGLTGGGANVGGLSLVNRWAAFNDDELSDLAADIYSSNDRHIPELHAPLDTHLLDEIQAELERRAST